MSYDQSHPVTLNTSDGIKLEEVDDFKYLGALMSSTAKYVNQRMAAAFEGMQQTI